MKTISALLKSNPECWLQIDWQLNHYHIILYIFGDPREDAPIIVAESDGGSIHGALENLDEILSEKVEDLATSAFWAQASVWAGTKE